MELLQEELGADGLDECCCLVCDRLVLRRDTVRKEGADWQYVDLLCKCLGGAGDDLPEPLRDQYRCPAHIQGLESVLVSPRGVHCYIDDDGNHDAWISICKKCDGCVRSQKLPVFAIANGFFCGR